MSQARIRQAFDAVLKTWAAAQSPAVAVAWENVKFTPTAALYVRPSLLPADTRSRDIGKTNRRYDGIYQIDVVAPTGVGPGASDTVVASLATTFPPATSIVVSGLRIFILEPLSPAPPIPDDDRYIVPCSLLYRADTY